MELPPQPGWQPTPAYPPPGIYSPASAPAPLPVPYAAPPPVNPPALYYPVPMMVVAPYGVDPRTGVPFSDKSKVAAGLLSIFLGSLGVGRFYTGHTGVGLTQLLLTLLLSWTLVVPVLVGVWALIDGIVLLAGNSRDAQGRPLR